VSERLPSEKEALEILVKSGCSRQVIRHCKAVSALATRIAEASRERGLNVDVQLVQIGALLHDVGRSVTHSVDHAIIGAELAKALGLPDSVVSIIERHAGGGITVDEAERLGWPVKDYVPKTLEEKIVTYADKLVEGSRIVKIERTIGKLSKDLGNDHPAIERVKQLHSEFSSLVGEINADSHTA
jgi:uncharacterized protein